VHLSSLKKPVPSNDLEEMEKNSPARTQKIKALPLTVDKRIRRNMRLIVFHYPKRTHPTVSQG
jgi:hypothetical protein